MWEVPDPALLCGLPVSCLAHSQALHKVTWKLLTDVGSASAFLSSGVGCLAVYPEVQVMWSKGQGQRLQSLRLAVLAWLCLLSYENLRVYLLGSSRDGLALGVCEMSPGILA